MKNKKIIWISIILIILICIIGFWAINHAKEKKEVEENNEEYIPEEEISEEQVRETIVSLYFPDKETNLLKPEARLVGIKDLMQSPYYLLIELLIGGPKNEKLKAVIPENTKLLGVSLEGECLILDFSEEFLNFDKENEKSKDNLINSIVNTVTELNEVNKVKVLINGEANDEFNEQYTRK